MLHLKNAERERLRLWSIRPCDVSADAFANQSKARSLQKRVAKRRANGVKPRIEYLAELKAKPKPWDGSGLSRWQWYRRNKVGTDSKRGVVETIVPKAEPHPVAAEQAEASKGLQGRGGLEKRREQAEEKQVEGEEQRGLSADRPRLVAREPHPLEEALQNWGKNAEKKNSTSSRNRIERGWNDLSDFAAFSTDVPWCPMEALPRDLPLVGELAA